MARSKKHVDALGVSSVQSPAKRGGCLKVLVWGLVGIVLLVVLALSFGGGDEDAPTAESPAPTSAPEETSPEVEARETNTSEEESNDETPSETEETSEDVVEEEPEEPVAEEAAPEDEMTSAQGNAVRAAENYLSFTPFSRQGLIDQLSSEYGDQYSVEDATFAVDFVEASVDWNDQAAKAAENYLELTPFSREGLIEQLSSEYGDQYTVEQATSGVDEIEASVDWNEQAARAAENYLEMTPFSREGLIDQLSSEYGDQYTVDQATYGVDAAGLE